MSGAPTQRGPAEAAPVPEFLTAGASFARYHIVRCIGVGGMGSVFEATHSLLRKRVALKAMHSTLGRSEGSRARFLREAETVARIRHPNVVDISDVGIERGVPFLVMEFLEGEDLAALLAREGRLSVERTVDLLLPVVAGLAAVHRLGIVHRDIKPENVFLAVDALGDVVPKLVDFGVSKDIEASTPDALLRHTVAGTPFYMAPEQARGSALLDARADQYALGVLLYQCLSGARPFQSESLLELLHLIDSGDYLPLTSHCPALPEPLAALVARAMAHRLSERFPSTEAFGQALAAFASEPVRKACTRDFDAERRPSLPARSVPAPPVASLSAPTVAEDAVSGATRALGRRSVSGVQARDSEGSAADARAAVRDPARPGRAARRAAGRAFWVAALITALCLLGLGTWYLARSTAPVARPAPSPVRPEVAPDAPPASTAPARAVGSDPNANEAAAPAPPAAPARVRRERPPNAPQGRSDIQLSR